MFYCSFAQYHVFEDLPVKEFATIENLLNRDLSSNNKYLLKVLYSFIP
jgi:hypothetical protein